MDQILDSSLKRQVQRHVLENPGTTIANISTALKIPETDIGQAIDENEDTFKKVRARGKSYRIYLRKKPHRARYGADLRRQKIQELVNSEPGITLSKLGLKVSASYQSIYNDVENGKIPGVRMGRGATRRKDIRLYPTNYKPELPPVKDHLPPAEAPASDDDDDDDRPKNVLRTEARRGSTRGPDPEIPERIKEVVTAEPGLTAKEIADRLENHVPYISKLLKEGIPGVQSRGRGVRGDPKKWFTYEGLRKQIEKKRIESAERAIEEEFTKKRRGPKAGDVVIDVIRENPGITVQGIAELTGKAPSYISTILNKGKVDGIVSRGSGSRNDPKRYYDVDAVVPAEEAETVVLTSDDLFREYLDNRTLSERSLSWLKTNFAYDEAVSVLENLKRFRKAEKEKGNGGAEPAASSASE